MLKSSSLISFNRFFYALLYFLKTFFLVLLPEFSLNKIISFSFYWHLVNSWNINQAFTFSLSLDYKEELKMQCDGLDSMSVSCFHSRKRTYVSDWQYINDNIPWKYSLLKTSWLSIRILVKKRKLFLVLMHLCSIPNDFLKKVENLTLQSCLYPDSAESRGYYLHYINWIWTYITVNRKIMKENLLN